MAKTAFSCENYPENFDLAVDMHARYDATTRKRVAKEVEPFKLMSLEEPVRAENIDAIREVRASTSTPILLRREPDFQKCGGLMEARKIADMAYAYYVPVVPHAVTSPIGMRATAHVCCVIPNFLVLSGTGSIPPNSGAIDRRGAVKPFERLAVGHLRGRCARHLP